MRSGGSSSSTRRTEAPAAPPRGGGAATLVFDSHCASCARFARLVRRLDAGGRIAFAALDDAAWEARLRPRLGAAYDRSFHLVIGDDDRVVSGGAALEDLARLLPPAAPFAAVVFKVPGVRGVPAAVYRAFAAGRACASEAAARSSKD